MRFRPCDLRNPSESARLAKEPTLTATGSCNRLRKSPKRPAMQFVSFHFRATLRHLSPPPGASDESQSLRRGDASLDLAGAQMFK